jgi:FkbM family methyltransferase
MCGHARASTIHERFDREEPQINELNRNLGLRFEGIEQRLKELRSENIELGKRQNAILESSLHLQREELKRIEEFAEETRQARQEAERLRNQVTASQQRVEALAEEVRQARQEEVRQYQEASAGAQQTHDVIVNFQNYTKSVFDEQLVRQVCVETSDYGFTNPETGLMAFLYSYLPTRKAIDVGAHIGEVSEALLKTGYEIYAFEPYAPIYEKLVKRLGRDNRFHPFPHALGCVEGEMPLHLAKASSNGEQWGDTTVLNSLILHSMPEGLPFSGTAMVKVKNLAGLHKANAIPEDISLVKIDTEGYDLEVIRGMGDYRYPVVATEYWDTEYLLGKSGLLYTMPNIVAEMRERGYKWYIVLYRVVGRNQTGFYCNHPRPVPKTWGNLVFFRDYELFSQGQAWCGAVLPRTYFKPGSA